MSVRRPPASLVALAAVATLVSGCGEETSPPPPAGDAVRASPEPPEGTPAPEGIEGVIAVGDLSTVHTEDPVEYPTYPPLGGDHFPVWLTCGVYDEPVPDEPAVHALEHGAIWITYRPDLAGAAVAALDALAATDGHLIVSPYPGLRAPVVVTAWGRQVDLDGIDDPRLQQFIDTYIRAGAAPEPGATCSDGVTP